MLSTKRVSLTKGSDPERTRKKIFESAEHCLKKLGFRGTTVREIGKLAGVNPALINYYFGSKERLLREVLAAKKVKVNDLSGFFMDPVVSKERVAQFSDLIFEEIGKDEGSFRDYVWAVVEGSDVSRGFAKEVWKPFIEILKGALLRVPREHQSPMTEDEAFRNAVILASLFQQFASLRWYGLDVLSLKGASRDVVLHEFRANVKDRVIRGMLE